jgi:hypothetical protein
LRILAIHLPAKAHHASIDEYSIATADRATIKVWTARRTSLPQSQVSGSPFRERVQTLIIRSGAPWILDAELLDYRRPACRIGYHDAKANRKDPQCRRGIPDTLTLTRNADLRFRSLFFSLKSRLGSCINAFNWDTLLSRPLKMSCWVCTMLCSLALPLSVWFCGIRTFCKARSSYHT